MTEINQRSINDKSIEKMKEMLDFIKAESLSEKPSELTNNLYPTEITISELYWMYKEKQKARIAQLS